jgi:hypothetical protein
MQAAMEDNYDYAACMVIQCGLGGYVAPGEQGYRSAAAAEAYAFCAAAIAADEHTLAKQYWQKLQANLESYAEEMGL